MNSHLVSWDSLAVRIDGARVTEIVRQKAGTMVESIDVSFRSGAIRVTGRKKVAFLALPFSADITSIAVEGKSVIVPIAGVANIPTAVLGGVLSFVRGLLSSKLPGDAISLRPPLTFVIQLDRFLPPFVDVQIDEILIVDGGLAVKMGPGGADPPPGGL